MRHLRLTAALAGIVAVCGLATVPVVRAATVMQWLTVPGASCQLSIPTTDTGVRPKATGFRNESKTTGNFAICTMASPTDLAGLGPFSVMTPYLQSLDGQAHEVSCTSVVGDGVAYTPPLAYSTKTIAVPATGYGQASWTAYDFGQGGAKYIGGSAWTTLTCNLPPQTAIKFVRVNYGFDIGS